MSGGSFNYLYNAETHELLEHYRISDMEVMEQILIAMGYVDIARDVRRLIEYCLSAENRISVLFEQLEDVFHDIEWYHSADIGEETLIKRLEKYRSGKGEYLTPSDVRKMTPKEVKENYDLIVQSMKYWK